MLLHVHVSLQIRHQSAHRSAILLPPHRDRALPPQLVPVDTTSYEPDAPRTFGRT